MMKRKLLLAALAFSSIGIAPLASAAVDFHDGDGVPNKYDSNPDNSHRR